MLFLAQSGNRWLSTREDCDLPPMERAFSNTWTYLWSSQLSDCCMSLCRGQSNCWTPSSVLNWLQPSPSQELSHYKHQHRGSDPSFMCSPSVNEDFVPCHLLIQGQRPIALCKAGSPQQRKGRKESALIPEEFCGTWNLSPFSYCP